MPKNTTEYMRDYRERRRLAGGHVRGTVYARRQPKPRRPLSERIKLALAVLRGER